MSVVCTSRVSVIAAGQQQNGGTGGAAKPPAPPIFVTVPPRTQKLVHSEAYLRLVLLLHILCDVSKLS